MNVKDYLDLSVAEVEKFADLAMESDYWESALKFTDERSDDLVDDLTKPQTAWLTKIKDDLDEEVSKRKWSGS